MTLPVEPPDPRCPACGKPSEGLCAACWSARANEALDRWKETRE